MHKLIAIDPGIHALGFAEFQDGALTAVSLVLVDMFVNLRGFRVWAHSVDDSRPAVGEWRPTRLCVEQPVVYPMREKRVDPKWLIMLAQVIGGVAVGLQWVEEADRPTPAIWKGRETKEVTQGRIADVLTPAEHEVARSGMPRQKSLWHNVWDAIGLGLWALGRMPNPHAPYQSRRAPDPTPVNLSASEPRAAKPRAARRRAK